MFGKSCRNEDVKSKIAVPVLVAASIMTEVLVCAELVRHGKTNLQFETKQYDAN